MSKLTIEFPVASQSAAAADNPFLAPDGMIANMDALLTFCGRVQNYISKGTDDPDAYDIRGYAYLARKARPVRYSSVKDGKGDIKYMGQRAARVKLTVRPLSEAGLVRFKLMMPMVVKGLPAAMQARAKDAINALKQHVLTCDRVKVKVQKARQSIRKEDQKSFATTVKLLKKVLSEAGIKDTSVVESSSMFGTVLLLKLSPDDVVQISKSDLSKFNAAKRALTSESSDLSESADLNQKWATDMLDILKHVDPKVAKAVEKDARFKEGVEISKTVGKKIVEAFKTKGYQPYEQTDDAWVIEQPKDDMEGLIVRFGDAGGVDKSHALVNFYNDNE